MASRTILSSISEKEEEDFVDTNKIDRNNNTENNNNENSQSENGGSSGGDEGVDSKGGRDKDKELKEQIKALLSEDTNSIIDANDDELNEIIEQLKKMGISKDKGLELQKIRSIKKARKLGR
ncbi:MAG TPA: hypothetical protein VLL98_03940 [Rickettsiales bacterium]|nr:hypothetical protein [Rickettsiales bacterium]